MQSKKEVNPQDFFTGKVSKDALSHLYTILPAQSLFALSATCKASRRVFKELTKTFYFIPDESLPIAKVEKGCIDYYLLPPADFIMSLYKKQANKVCYRTFRDAQNHIEHLYRLSPNRQNIPPIIELVIDNARQLPRLTQWKLMDMGSCTVPRIMLDVNEDIFRMSRATFLRKKSRRSFALVPVVNSRGEDHVVLENAPKDAKDTKDVVSLPKAGCSIQ